MSCNVEGFFENILLQDTVIEQNLYLITIYSYFKRKVSYYKMLLFVSVSRYYLQDTKIRYCPSLIMNNMKMNKHATKRNLEYKCRNQICNYYF